VTENELSSQDLQRSPEQDPGRHRRSSALLQDAVTVLAHEYVGASEAEATAAFEAALADRGLPPQPERWVEAVVAAAVEGRVYVVNEQALTDTGTEVPALNDVQHAEEGSDED
jgi:hypothetical protein